MVGSSGDSTRIVFFLKTGDTISPDLVEQNQTLIVNFPHTVAKPQTIQDRYMIQHLSFDGTRAVITMKRPFSYKYSFKQLPSRLVIDISGKKAEEKEEACPIRRFELMPGTSRLSVVMFLAEGSQVDVRATRGNRLFIHFPSEVSCTDLGGLLEGIPQLTFVNLMKMASGATLTLSIDDQYTLSKTRIDRDGTRITFEMNTSGPASPETREVIAQSLYDAGNSAGVIATLKPHLPKLSPCEKILLARSYWSLAYPYKMGENSSRSLSLMNEAIQELPEGPGRERILLEYCSMLIHAGQPGEAGAPLSLLKNSVNQDIRAEASIWEMDTLNRAGSYQDA